ncbi:hypothetical protein HPB50_011749 [Hyalomma asiaticum]|uniref:Uncharacterized protein n=1 Tax=Hyalomma asiaticum TaxID=266040 RepID=A0ACB7RT71_HYAAI|nr:hypothetical protein HPB50_011749 [Hyalomma asiaticum]
MAHLVLQMVLNVSRMLQDPKINLLAAFQGVNDLQEATKGMRLDESAFTKVFQGATEICQTRGIRIPAVRQRKVSRSVAVNFASQFFHETKEEELSVSVFYAMLDAFVEGMEARFTQEAVVLISAIMNILRLTGNDEEIDVVTKYFDMESDSLRAQLRLMKAQVRGARRLAAQLTEFWWGRCLIEVRIRSKSEGKMSGSRGFVAFGDVVIPEEVADVLNKGPKYSYEPTVSAHDLLALNRSVSNKAGQEAQERCLLEGVEALKKTVNTKVTKVARDPTKRVVSFFEENKLRLLQADKTGGFFVLREEDFSRKAEQAIAKNFVRVKPSATRIKSRAAAMCKDLELTKLAKNVTKLCEVLRYLEADEEQHLKVHKHIQPAS